MNSLGLNLDKIEAHPAAADGLHSGGWQSPLFTLLLFFVLHLVAGAALPYRQGYRPPLAYAMEGAGNWLSARLNRPYLYRQPRGRARLAARGFALLLVLAALSALAGLGVNALKSFDRGGLGELILLTLSVSVMTPLKVLRETGRQLEKKNTLAAAAALFPYIPADLSVADAYALGRRALEFGAIALLRYVAGPVFIFILCQWAGIGYLAGALTFYAAVNLPAGGQGPFWRALRAVAAILNFIPACIAAVLLSIAALFVSQSSPKRALTTLAAQAAYFSPRAQGCLVAATAGGIGVTLGGPAPLREEIPERSEGDSPQNNFRWVGPEGSSAKISISDLQRGNMIIFVAYLCVIVLVSCIFMLSYYLP